MASAFVGNICDTVEFYKDFPPLGAGESTHGMRNSNNFQELEEQSLIKLHALSDRVFLQLRRKPPPKTIHFKQAEQTNGELTSTTFHSDTLSFLSALFHGFTVLVKNRAPANNCPEGPFHVHALI